ncbi:hypothetical protein [Streptomyces olivaceus]|uniref:hypothetical protein n=1 Tax=Streptomyces olivaceus TaxID=47716 RepID=UPI001CC934D4|nr:hypothetical protein [Streptomyces olivaceus]MBZ6228665.1 hypothetical protein [Streptomyces olivaceus]
MVRAGRSHTPDLTFAVEVPPLYDGTDTLRIQDGRFVEYWLNADGLHMLQQLQAA